MLILRFGLAHVLFSNFAHMCLRIVPLTDNSKLIIKIPMIMKNQLLNLKMIALMCLMMVLGGANVWAEEEVISLANGSFAKDQITWTGTSCSIIQSNRNSSTRPTSDYVNEPRWYKSHVV